MGDIKINNNYIIWSLISIPIFLGIFLIVQLFIVRAGNEIIPNEVKISKTLVNPPEVIRAIYWTSNTAQSEKSINHLIELASKTDLNAVIIDIKDFSGYISYDTNVADAEKYKTERTIIKDIDGLIKKLHDNNIYVIGRMAVFQDPALVRARPDRAVQNKYTGKPWADRHGLSWIDPACRECWDYYAAIAKDALDKGFDEINMDYVRFPTDGNMEALVFRNNGSSRTQVLNEFFKYMRTSLGDARLSADLFGFVTTRTEDFGVGQVMEDAFEYFDYVAPMVYPSHYPDGFLKFANPAEHPYEVINYTMKSGGERLKAFKQKTGNMRPNLRPWIQDFDLGADYNQAMVEAEIKATQDALGENYKGFMLWNARNVYTESVFK